MMTKQEERRPQIMRKKTQRRRKTKGKEGRKKKKRKWKKIKCANVWLILPRPYSTSSVEYSIRK